MAMPRNLAKPGAKKGGNPFATPGAKSGAQDKSTPPGKKESADKKAKEPFPGAAAKGVKAKKK